MSTTRDQYEQWLRDDAAATPGRYSAWLVEQPTELRRAVDEGMVVAASTELHDIDARRWARTDPAIWQALQEARAAVRNLGLLMCTRSWALYEQSHRTDS